MRWRGLATLARSDVRAPRRRWWFNALGAGGAGAGSGSRRRVTAPGAFAAQPAGRPSFHLLPGEAGRAGWSPGIDPPTRRFAPLSTQSVDLPNRAALRWCGDLSALALLARSGVTARGRRCPLSPGAASVLALRAHGVLDAETRVRVGPAPLRAPESVSVRAASAESRSKTCYLRRADSRPTCDRRALRRYPSRCTDPDRVRGDLWRLA
jgi:hypothetical protein